MQVLNIIDSKKKMILFH